MRIIFIQDYKHTKLIWMEVHMYSVKAKSQARKIWVSQTYNDIMKWPNLQDILPGILITYAFSQKLQWRVSGPGKSTDRVT